MKKICLTAMMLVLLVTGAYAQARIGVRAGLNLADVAGDHAEGMDMRLGYHVGAVLNFGITETIFWQPEWVLSQQGSAYSLSDDFGTSEGRLTLTYLNIPLLVKVVLVKGLHLQAGPQIGLLLSARDKGDFSGSGDVVAYNEELKDISVVDFGAVLGVGYQFSSGVNLSLRYNKGFSNIYDGVNSEQLKLTNSVVQFSVGYLPFGD